MLLPVSYDLIVHLQHLVPDPIVISLAPTNRRDLDNDHWLRQTEIRGGKFEGIFGGVTAADAGSRDGTHAFVMVLICDD